jgi:hypothetical protein
MDSGMEIDHDYVIASLRSVRHDEKWHILRPLIQPLFETCSVSKIAKTMKEDYGFDAK